MSKPASSTRFGSSTSLHSTTMQPCRHSGSTKVLPFDLAALLAVIDGLLLVCENAGCSDAKKDLAAADFEVNATCERDGEPRIRNDK